MSTEPVVYSLRRPNSDKSWGFALQGGADQGLPVFVHKITRNGIAHKSGLEPGDVIVKICKTALSGMSNSQVKAELLRAGNDLDFTVLKHAFNVANYNASMQQMNAAAGGVGPGGAEERSEIVEEHLWRHGGPLFKNVQPKSYKILEQQLPQSAMGASGDAQSTAITGDVATLRFVGEVDDGLRSILLRDGMLKNVPVGRADAGTPGSVFDRNTDERSPYLQATEQTIQKAYGES